MTIEAEQDNVLQSIHNFTDITALCNIPYDIIKPFDLHKPSVHVNPSEINSHDSYFTSANTKSTKINNSQRTNNNSNMVNNTTRLLDNKLQRH